MKIDKKISWLFGTILIVAIIFRVYSVTFPITGDEANTHGSFINNSWKEAFCYSDTNNHLLNTVLSKLSIYVFGDTLWAIRIFSTLASIGSVITVYYLCKMYSINGLFAMLLTAVFPIIVFQESLSRGYGLVGLFTVLLFYIGKKTVDSYTNNKIVILSLITALGAFSIPSFLFSGFSFFLWFSYELYKKREFNYVKKILYYGALSLFFTIIIYSPVIFTNENYGLTVVNNRYVIPLYWKLFLGSLPIHLRLTLTDIFTGVDIFSILVLIVLIVIGLYFMVKKNHQFLRVFLSLFIGTVFILFLKRVLPFSRNYIYMLPFFFCVADYALYSIICKFGFKEKTYLYLNIILLFIIPSTLYFNDTLMKYFFSRNFPDAPWVAEYLLNTMDRSVDFYISHTPADQNLMYYLGKRKFTNNKSSEGKPYYVVQKSSRYSISDLTTDPVEKILDVGDVLVYKGL